MYIFKDTIGIHLMGNYNKAMKTITLHCYAPPYQRCHKYDPGILIL